MDELAKNLKKRAKELGLKEIDVAKRLDIDPKRYNNYTLGNTEPDLALLVQIAKTLDTRPDILLGFEAGPATSSEERLRERISAALNAMDEADQKVLAACADAMVKTRRG